MPALADEAPAAAAPLAQQTTAARGVAPNALPAATLPQPATLQPRPVPAPSPPPTAAPANAPTTVPGADLRALVQVNPDIPPLALRRVSSFNELLVEVSVRTDGTVSDARVLTPGMRPIESYVVEALKQWRFAPLPAPRTQRLMLDFGS